MEAGKSKGRKDIRGCEAANCESIVNCYKWPSDVFLAARWTTFVKNKVANFTKPHARSRLCWKHFKADDFHNWGPFHAGLNKQLRLKAEAIPTVQLTGQEHTTCAPSTSTSASASTSTTSSSTSRERRSILREALSANQPSVFKVVYLPARDGRLRVPCKRPPPQLTGLSVGLQTRSNWMRPCRRSKAVQTEHTGYPVEKLAEDGNDGNDIESDGSHHSTEYGSSSDPDEVITADEKDLDWEPETHCPDGEPDEDDIQLLTEIERKGEFFDSPKVIVDVAALEHLLECCRACAGRASLSSTRSGAYIQYAVQCLEKSCGHSFSFETTPKVGRIPTINPLLSASTLFNGGLQSKLFRILSSLKIAVPSTPTFFRHQKDYLHGVIRDSFNKAQAEVRAAAVGKDVHLTGDGKCDSPGHSALYGMYTVMDTANNKILACEVVKSTETTSSNAMELEGLKRCFSSLEADSITIQSLTTDGHPHIESYMKKEKKNILHYFDAWHVVKGMKKKLSELSKVSAFRKIGQWIQSICNHLHWTVNTTAPHSGLRKDKWLSVMNHLENIHRHTELASYPQCEHAHLPETFELDGKPMVIDYLKAGGKLSQNTEKILKNEKLLNSIMKTSHHATGDLESFHSQHNRNCPKMHSFNYSGMISRSQITVLHHNENSTRQLARNKDGSQREKIIRKKVSQLQPTIYNPKEAATFNYRDELFLSLERHILHNTRPQYSDKAVPTLASTGPQMSKSEIIKRQTTRGLKRKPHHVPAGDVEEEGSRRRRKK